ncbi:MAG: DUF1194 domain-containing protein [Nodularia sp. CChRGM 3473]
MKTANFFRATLTTVTCGLSVLTISATANAATLVDLELSLLVDVSGSVDNTEFALQRDGYVNTFSNPNLFNNFISQGSIGQIAVNLVYWSGSNQQQESVGWTLIDSVAAAQNFANAIAAAPRPFSGLTAIGSAIDFAVPGFFTNDFDGTRLVIDVSGDGATNSGSNTAAARDAALAAGIDAINGVVIGNEGGLANFYQNNVIGGTNATGVPAFLRTAATFEEFGAVVQEKISSEILPPTSVPEPASLIGLLGLGAFGVTSKLKRKQKLQVNG